MPMHKILLFATGLLVKFEIIR